MEETQKLLEDITPVNRCPLCDQLIKYKKRGRPALSKEERELRRLNRLEKLKEDRLINKMEKLKLKLNNM